MLKYGVPLIWYDGEGLSRTAQAGDSAGTWRTAYGPSAPVGAGTPTIQAGPNGTRAVEYVGANHHHAIGVAMPSAITVAFVARLTWDATTRDDISGSALALSELFIIRNQMYNYRNEMNPDNIWAGFAGYDGLPRVVAAHGMTGTRWGVIAASMSSTQANLAINGRVPSSFVARVAGTPVGTINRLGDYGESNGTRRIARFAAWPRAMNEQELINLSRDWMSEFGLISRPRWPFTLFWEPPPPSADAVGTLGSLDAQAIAHVVNTIQSDGPLGSLNAQAIAHVINTIQADGPLGSLSAQAIVQAINTIHADGRLGRPDAQAILHVLSQVYGVGGVGGLSGQALIQIAPAIFADGILGFIDAQSQILVPQPTFAFGELTGFDGSAYLYHPRFSTQTPAALAIALESTIPQLGNRVVTYRAPESFTLPYIVVYPVSEMTFPHSGPIHHQIEVLRAEVRAKTAAEADAIVDLLYPSPPIGQFLVGLRRAIACYRRNVFRSLPSDRDEKGHDLHRRIVEYQVVVEVNQRLQ